MRFLLSPAVLTALFCAALLGACGEQEGPPAEAVPEGRVVTPIEDVPLEERARYAFERLLTGPEPQSVLPIRKMQSRMLTTAIFDLVAMKPQTVALLRDPARVKRVTDPARKDTNPWHGVLDVLLALEEYDAELIRPWVEPAIRRRTDTPLRRRAAHVISMSRDPEIGPVVLEFLRMDAGDREIDRRMLEALVGLGSPWLERGIRLVLERGSPRGWVSLPDALSYRTDPGISASNASALAWAGTWLEGSGPRPPTRLPSVARFEWSGLRALLDEQSARTPLTGSGHRSMAYGPIAEEMAYGAGWHKAPFLGQTAMSPSAWFMTGREAAAECRCTLAIWNFDTYVHQREIDEALPVGLDEQVRMIARHCVSPAREPVVRERNVEDLERLVTEAPDAPNPAAHVKEMLRLIGGLPPVQEPRVSALLRRMVKSLRPVSVFQPVISQAYTALTVLGQPALDFLEEMTRSSDPVEQGIALQQIRNLRHADYLPMLEAWLARARGEQRDELFNAAIWVYSSRFQIEPVALRAFVTRYATWVRERLIPERGAARAALTAAGLLDFGVDGARAYARFMEEDDTGAFVTPLIERPGLLQRPIVEAALAKLGEHAPADRIQITLELAWLRFPASAAADVAALRQVLPARYHPAVDVVLRRVQHRPSVEPTGN
jgi:hypothetical protein